MDTEHKEQADKICPHPVAEAINRFVYRARNIRLTARLFVPAAIEFVNERLNNIKKQLVEGEVLLSSEDQLEKVHGVEMVSDLMPRLEQLRYSNMPTVIESSLFLSL